MVKSTLVALLLVLPGVVDAQRTGGMPTRGGPPPHIEQQLQARLDSIVRERLSLSDDQFVRVRDVATRIERDRRELRREEGEARIALRRELTTAPVNEDRVAELLERLPRLERRRLELMDREQRELAKFLQPSQRARYLALQEELRREMQEVMRRRLNMDSSRMGRGGGGPPGRRPPR